MSRHKPRLGILISGRGTNMTAILDAIDEGRLDAEAAVVISNRPEAPGLGLASARGIATVALDHRAHAGREPFDAAVDEALGLARVDVVACAGFMRVMTPRLIDPWAGRMLNVHPSLLPAFRGLDTFARALAEGCAVAGCTVHEVTLELDAGRILGQAVVPILPGDTAESLDARLLPMQHRLYPAVLAAFLRDPEAARRTPIAIAADEGWSRP